MPIVITVYTKPSSVHCAATVKALDAFIEGGYKVVDASRDPETVQRLVSLGHLQLPTIMLSDEDGGTVTLDDGTDKGVSSWSGFCPDHIERLRRRLVA